ncbi:ArsR/SmtB family transcription factor [Phocicoccus pinnipedialis]|uniref:Transcriptional repressor SdpR n=1 Tax=Phocicoccus pinnipedialis TaxID=110845 RepID=A0A6V7R4K8_9BACL|nr:metalloregulator ArsR/SmtB family transcription factor [Jeotgalicoccus pinnipedialis]MBP1939757.1 ArsR family transcriptional regulator [Jeotgalicoccus pinnipedialis]CAD2072379.1 Transcriptional repressor SdpR [Jeotgalicoccus pinnipedialis]
MSYQSLAAYLKILSNPSRLEILDLLSCGELCACDLLEHFQFTQPTLSHHMKTLVENDLVIARKVGNKQMYQINHYHFDSIIQHLNNINMSHTSCICKNLEKVECSL